ncbi:MAG: hypothetical protein AUK35_08225 [Zetaproteobacteria bacterium CG2_30_46_52]|nr:MAG: hypothetical protein AUK35_08225 [Zetaproteobacteria bacterium CG2_30_46_52]
MTQAPSSASDIQAPEIWADSPHPSFNLTLDVNTQQFKQLPAHQGSSSRLAMYEKSIRTLPLPPALWRAFQAACDRGDSSQQLGKIIKDDPVLSAATLRIANSSGFGLRTPINDVGRAVSHLGTSMVRSIVTRHSFSSTLAKGKVYDMPKLWKHGMAVSALAEIIAEFVPDCVREDASTLGLFHDIGKMSMNLFTQYQQPATLDSHQGHLLFEHAQFGCNHIDLGLLLAKHWELPSKIIEGIAFHHHPGFAAPESIPESIRPEVFAVFLADAIAIRLGFDTGHAGIVLPLAAYATLLANTSLMALMESPKIHAELARIEAIEF